MSIGWSDLTAEGRRYFDELEKLENMEVHVGFQSDQSYEDGTSLCEVAAYNELGTSSSPARPFMRKSFEDHQRELQSYCDEVNGEISRGGTTGTALEKLGVKAKALVQQEIVEGEFAPNAPYTIKKKGSARPLIDTGHMRQSVNYQVKPRE